MRLRDILKKAAKVLDELKIDYFVSGGLAVSVWGRPRHTADIDIVIEIGNLKSIRALCVKLKKIFPDAYVDLDQAVDALNRSSDFNVIEPESGIKVDFWIRKGTKYEKTRFKNVRFQKVENYPVKFVSPEDLIIIKLKWYKESKSTRHLEDIQSILSVSRNLNQKYLNFWIKKLGLERTWKKSQEMI